MTASLVLVGLAVPQSMAMALVDQISRSVGLGIVGFAIGIIGTRGWTALVRPRAATQSRTVARAFALRYARRHGAPVPG